MEIDVGTFPWAMELLRHGRMVTRRENLRYKTHYELREHEALSGMALFLVDRTGTHVEEDFNADDILAIDWCEVTHDHKTGKWDVHP